MKRSDTRSLSARALLGSALALLAVMSATATVARSQRFQGRVRVEPNAPYDGRFTFVRLRYTVHTRSG